MIVAGGLIHSQPALRSLAHAICPDGSSLFTITGDGRPFVRPSSVAAAEAQIIETNRLGTPLYLYTGDVEGQEQHLLAVLTQHDMTFFALRSWVFEDAEGNPIDDRSVFVDAFKPGVGGRAGALTRRYRPSDPFVTTLEVPPIQIAASVAQPRTRGTAAKNRCEPRPASNVVPLHVHNRTRSGRWSGRC